MITKVASTELRFLEDIYYIQPASGYRSISIYHDITEKLDVL